MKNVVMLATVHEYQMLGSNRNSELGERLAYLKSKFNVQVVLEEWSEQQGQSFAATFAAKSGLAWANVGTPDEEQFRTYRCPPINHPAHDGALQPPDWDAPSMSEYGPFKTQEARENEMTKNIRAEMENRQSALFVLGLAHLHSLLSKLLVLGFNVTGYSWLQRHSSIS